MSKKRYIDTKFWSDGYIDSLDPTEKLLFLYLLTNERTNVAGVYELPVKLMAVETGIEKNMVEKVLDRFVRDGKVSRAESWVKLTNYQKHQNLDNSKIATGIANAMKLVPETILDELSGLTKGHDESYMSHEDTSRVSINSDSDSDLDSNSDFINDTNVSLAKPTTYGKSEINELFAYWEQCTGIPISARRQANRNACNNLLKRYSPDKIRQLIDGVAQAQADRYAPRIADFSDLQSKLNQLLTWGRQHNQQPAGKVRVIS